VANTHGGPTFISSYRVTVPARVTGRSARRNQFAKLKDAKRWAENAMEGWQQRGRAFFSMDDTEWFEFSARLPKLRERGIGVGEALDNALRTLNPKLRNLTLRDVVGELVGLRAPWLMAGDLRERWGNLRLGENISCVARSAE